MWFQKINLSKNKYSNNIQHKEWKVERTNFRDKKFEEKIFMFITEKKIDWNQHISFENLDSIRKQEYNFSLAYQFHNFKYPFMRKQLNDIYFFEIFEWEKDESVKVFWFKDLYNSWWYNNPSQISVAIWNNPNKPNNMYTYLCLYWFEIQKTSQIQNIKNVFESVGLDNFTWWFQFAWKDWFSFLDQSLQQLNLWVKGNLILWVFKNIGNWFELINKEVIKEKISFKSYITNYTNYKKLSHNCMSRGSNVNIYSFNVQSSANVIDFYWRLLYKTIWILQNNFLYFIDFKDILNPKIIKINLHKIKDFVNIDNIKEEIVKIHKIVFYWETYKIYYTSGSKNNPQNLKVIYYSLKNNDGQFVNLNKNILLKTIHNLNWTYHMQVLIFSDNITAKNIFQDKETFDKIIKKASEKTKEIDEAMHNSEYMIYSNGYVLFCFNNNFLKDSSFLILQPKTTQNFSNSILTWHPQQSNFDWGITPKQTYNFNSSYEITISISQYLTWFMNQHYLPTSYWIKPTHIFQKVEDWTYSICLLNIKWKQWIYSKI